MFVYHNYNLFTICCSSSSPATAMNKVKQAFKHSESSPSLITQMRQAQRAAKQLAGVPVFSVEEEAGQWRDLCMVNIVAEDQEQKTIERENKTVFVMPTTPQTSDGQSRWEYLKGGDPENASLGWMSELQDGDTTTLGSSSEDTLSHDLERVSLGSLGKWTWDIHSIVLDLSTANFIDTVAIKTIKNASNLFWPINMI